MDQNTNETTHHSNPTKTAEVASNNGRGRGRGAMVLALIAIMFAFGSAALGWFTWQQSKLLRTYQKQIRSDVVGDIGELTKKQLTLNNQLQQQATQLLRMNRLIKARDVDAGESQWTLTEAAYLLHLANYTLQFKYDAQTAKAILTIIDRQLVDLNDSRFAELRRVLASDIASLAAVKKVDYFSVAKQLNDLSDQIGKLPLRTPTTAQPQEAQTMHEGDEKPQDKPSWRKHLDDSMKQIQKLIVIRHHSQAVTPLLAPQQQMYMQQNIQVKLLQAEGALLQRQQELFHQSIEQVKHWLGSYYDTDAEATKEVLNKLNELSAINIAPELPNLDNAISAMKQAQQVLMMPTKPSEDAQETPTEEKQAPEQSPE